MEDKPIIRHCRNCKYYCDRAFKLYDCDVKYVDVLLPRLTALFCRFYKKKENDNGKC